MTPDVVLSWLKCAGYGLGLVVAGYISVRELNRVNEKIAAERAKAVRDCRTCALCIAIDGNGWHYCSASSVLNSSKYPHMCSFYKPLEDEHDT